MESVTMVVCPHDSVRNTEGWHRLSQYLAGYIGLELHCALALDFTDFYGRYAEADLVYASPGDALTLIDQYGFAPLVRPTDTYDEALIITSLDVPAQTVEALDGSALAAIEGSLPTRLALRMLQSRGIVPGPLVGRDSWLSVVRAVWGGEAPFGILYQDAYDALSPQGKAMVQVVTATSERCAFHVLCAAPGLGANAGAFADTLVAMAGDAAGRDVLADMHLVGWRPVSPDELAVLRSLLG